MLTFQSPYTQYQSRNGQMCSLIATIDKSDPDYDEEVLPMYIVEFEDGMRISAFPEEVGFLDELNLNNKE